MIITMKKALCCVLVLLTLLSCFTVTALASDNNAGKSAFGYIAHRGTMDFYPDNTIEGFEKAIALHYKYIECDIFQGADDNIFVCHESTIKDKTGAKHSISELTMENRESFPAPVRKAMKKLFNGRTFTIPTLEEVLDVVKKSIDDGKSAPAEDGYRGIRTLLIHLKKQPGTEKGDLDKAHIARLKKAISSRSLTDNVMLISSYKSYLEGYPEFKKGYLYSQNNTLENIEKYAKQVYEENKQKKASNPAEKGVTALMLEVKPLPDKELTKDEMIKNRYILPDKLVSYVKSLGFSTVAYPVNSEKHAAVLAANGINAILCNKLMFTIDKSLTKCELSLTGYVPDGELCVADEGGSVVSVVQSAEALTLNGKLSPGESYRLVRYASDKTTKLSSSEPFTINNTDEEQQISVVFKTPQAAEPATELDSRATAPTRQGTQSKTQMKKSTAVKQANPIRVTAIKKTVKASDLKLKSRRLKVLRLKNAKGKITVKLIKKGSSKKLFKRLKISKKGVITIKKGSYRKSTRRIRVKIRAGGNSRYLPKTIIKTIKIKIK